MCLIVIVHRVVEGVPLLIGANREEYYARGGEFPNLHEGNTPYVCGTDPVAGGTWLGVNAHGVVVAVTNRPKALDAQPERSRGLLVRDLLDSENAKEASERALEILERHRFAGCNLLCADLDRAIVIHAGDWLRVKYLPPGVHVLANNDVNDPRDDRVVHVSCWLHDRRWDNPSVALASLCEVCSHHEPDQPPICFRHEKRGTVSSTVFGLAGDSRFEPVRCQYLHAQGPPSEVDYDNQSELLRALSGEEGAS